MGFFDKLRDVAATAKDSINKAIETAQNIKNPLADDTVRMYYEIIFGLRETVGMAHFMYLKKRDEIAKAYIEKKRNNHATLKR